MERATGSIIFRNAEVVFAHGIEHADIRVEGGIITDFEGPAESEVDAIGLLLAPALIDVHGDAFERQMMPRPGVFFPMDVAVLETDRQLAANGIATAYHAVTLGWQPGLRDLARAKSVIEALVANAGRFTVDNRVQLRWETFAFEAEGLIRWAFDQPIDCALAFNDHTSIAMRSFDVRVQDRAFPHSEDFQVADPNDPRLRDRWTKETHANGLSMDDFVALMAKVWARRSEVPAAIERIATAGRAAGVPMFSHDDSSAQTRAFFHSHGSRVSEFPMAKSAATEARQAGDLIVFGAPNAARGGSHLGSPSAGDMVEEGLCDVLASDYYYPALLAAMHRLDQERRAPRHELWKLVSLGAARACGLEDRGEIAIGKRADLVLVDWPDGQTPAIRATYSGGKLAYGTAVS